MRVNHSSANHTKFGGSLVLVILHSQVVSEVKAKKMETMKGIKRLQVQKESLSKKQKQAKADYDKVSAQPSCLYQVVP